MEMYIDGGCRYNGSSNAIGAAACVIHRRWGGDLTYTRKLPSYTTPTSQRAEITAIILALEQGLSKSRDLDTSPRMNVTIYTDSKYAHGCMTDWVYKWSRNGWINAAGNSVANRDLIEQASDLDDDLKEYGVVNYVWVPRSENQKADEAAGEVLNEMDDDYYSSDAMSY